MDKLVNFVRNKYETITDLQPSTIEKLDDTTFNVIDESKERALVKFMVDPEFPSLGASSIIISRKGRTYIHKLINAEQDYNILKFINLATLERYDFVDGKTTTYRCKLFRIFFDFEFLETIKSKFSAAFLNITRENFKMDTNIKDDLKIFLMSLSEHSLNILLTFMRLVGDYKTKHDEDFVRKAVPTIRVKQQELRGMIEFYKSYRDHFLNPGKLLRQLNEKETVAKNGIDQLSLLTI